MLGPAGQPDFAAGLPAGRRYRFYNGPLECELRCFDVRAPRGINAADKPRGPAPVPTLDSLGPEETMLANRLRKNRNRRPARRWPARELALNLGRRDCGREPARDG